MELSIGLDVYDRRHVWLLFMTFYELITLDHFHRTMNFGNDWKFCWHKKTVFLECFSLEGTCRAYQIVLLIYNTNCCNTKKSETMFEKVKDGNAPGPDRLSNQILSVDLFVALLY